MLVVGAGAAGLAAALELAPKARVGILSKGSGDATRRAQGGIAAVLGSNDSIEAHTRDTLQAGRGLCDQAVVEFAVAHSQDCIHWLQQMGVRFSTASGGQLHLSREGGHSIRRVAHFQDETGREINRALTLLAAQNPRIELLPHTFALDILAGSQGGGRRCLGVRAVDTQSHRQSLLSARAVILATGGASKMYRYSTNAEGACGDGMAMAWRAGCELKNLEFQQFHPTCLYHPKVRSLLLTEALRGEGALLQLPDGASFLAAHGIDELAPRDQVARAMHREMQAQGLTHLNLDMRPIGAARMQAHFPSIERQCRELGLDPNIDPVPVVPAAHYSCGGVASNLHAETDLPGLYAAGETAYTGLHGANRMASNSLLECLVFGRAAGRHILSSWPALTSASQLADSTHRTPTENRPLPPQPELNRHWQHIKDTMWQQAGLIRSNTGLATGLEELLQCRAQLAQLLADCCLTAPLAELRNMLQMALLTVHSASMRRESRGLHTSLDYPDEAAEALNSVVNPAQCADLAVLGAAA